MFRPVDFAFPPWLHVASSRQSSLGNRSRHFLTSRFNSPRHATASLDLSPCRQFGWAGPDGCPPPAPCTRQTRQPVTAGARQGWPVRLAVARHLGAARALLKGLLSSIGHHLFAHGCCLGSSCGPNFECKKSDPTIQIHYQTPPWLFNKVIKHRSRHNSYDDCKYQSP